MRQEPGERLWDDSPTPSVGGTGARWGRQLWIGAAALGLLACLGYAALFVAALLSPEPNQAKAAMAGWTGSTPPAVWTSHTEPGSLIYSPDEMTAIAVGAPTPRTASPPVAASLAASSASSGSCSPGERRMLNDRIRDTAAWTDTVKLADATPRVALSGPIAKMQELRRQAQAQRTDWPPCAATAYSLYLQAMDADIASRLAFSAQQPYEAQRVEADRLYSAVAAEWGRLTR